MAVSMWWDSIEVDGRPDYVLANKPKALKGKLKKWNLTRHGKEVIKLFHHFSIFFPQLFIEKESKFSEKRGKKKTEIMTELLTRMVMPRC